MRFRLECLRFSFHILPSHLPGCPSVYVHGYSPVLSNIDVLANLDGSEGGGGGDGKRQVVGGGGISNDILSREEMAARCSISRRRNNRNVAYGINTIGELLEIRVVPVLDIFPDEIDRIGHLCGIRPECYILLRVINQRYHIDDIGRGIPSGGKDRGGVRFVRCLRRNKYRGIPVQLTPATSTH